MERENKNKSTFTKGALALSAVVATSTLANASMDLSTLKLDVSQVEVIGLTIMGALASIWVVKKVISML